MNYRQKTLLGLLSAFGGHLPSTDFQKYLFLYTREFQQEPSFEFVPYRFGSFSFQSYADKRRLVEMGALANAEDWQLPGAPFKPSFGLSGVRYHGKLKRLQCA